MSATRQESTFITRECTLEHTSEENKTRETTMEPQVTARTAAPPPVVFEAFHDLYFLLDGNGGIVDYRAGNADLYVEPEKFIGRRMQDVLPTPVGGLFAEAIIRVREQQKAVELEYPLTIEGVERQFEARLLPLPASQIAVVVRDVTPYAKISAARDQLAAILEATPDFVGTADAQYHALYLNRAGRGMIGLSEDEAMPAAIAGFHPAWASEIILTEGIPMALREGVWSGETALCHQDGHEIPVSQVILAHKAPDGTLAYLSTIARDISEPKQAEAALRESQRRLATLIDSLPGIAFVAQGEPPWTMSYFSEGCFQLTGYRRDELVNTPHLSYGNITHPDDWPELVKKIQDAVTTRNPYVCEYRIHTKDGEEKWVWEKGSGVCDSQGNVIGLEGFITDITENKRTEQALQRQSAAMEASMDGMAILDRDGNYLYVNSAHARIYGYQNPRELIGQHWSLFYQGRELDRFHTQIMPTFGEHGQWSGETVGTRRDGSLFPQEISLNKLPDGGLVYVVRDISGRKQSEQALQQAESKYRSIFENAIEGIFQTTPDGRYLSANPALARIYGYNSAVEMMQGISDIAGQLYLEPKRRDEFVRLMSEQDQVAGFESPIRRKDSSVIWISENSRAIRNSEGNLSGYEGTVMDISARKEAEADRFKAEAALRDSEARLRDIVEHSSNMFYSRTPEHILTYVSPQVRRFLDYEPEQALVRLTEFTTDNPINQAGFEIAQHAIDTGQTQPIYNLELVGKKGRTVFVEVNEAPVVREGKTVALVGALVDITQRHAVEQELKHQAFHDSLTNLPNRSLFMDRLQHALSRLKRHKESLAVLFLDLDRFKIINDSLGHEVGDQLLQAVAERLISCLRPDDTVARLGGDEFTILMESIGGVDDAVLVAERIADALQQPFTLNGQEVFMTTSVGIAVSYDGGDSPEDLLRDADVAMYRAKIKGRAQHEVFDPDMNARAMERLTLETDLWQAIGRGELRVHYQPKMDLRSGQIVGVEALVRWQHPQHGLVPPGDFISLAEETGIILNIGQWVLREACLQACRWVEQELSATPLQMSVNLSVRQLQQPNLADEVAAVLAETGLAPHLLKLEITESVIMGDAEHTIAMLRDLKALGVHLAIDDFGTGYSSLSYLRRFPMTTLKIDRSFISNLGVDREDTEIVRAIISLAQTLGLNVTAEGVETAAQMEQLQALGCDWGQGYFFSRPLATDAMNALLTHHRELAQAKES
jgi:diguanylate cyclase (GGDEF)-like protein/PAS domain S-box-containing protein